MQGVLKKKRTNTCPCQSIDTKIYFKDKEVKIPYNVVSKSLKREILSIDLEEGMTIKAVTNKNRRQALENKEK